MEDLVVFSDGGNVEIFVRGVRLRAEHHKAVWIGIVADLVSSNISHECVIVKSSIVLQMWAVQSGGDQVQRRIELNGRGRDLRHGRQMKRLASVPARREAG